METAEIKAPTVGSLSTRRLILVTAANEIHRYGFQGARVDRIIETAKVAKGAFYHHFRSKLELGYAVVDECMATAVEAVWLRPLNLAVDPVAAFRTIVKEQAKLAPAIAELGEPVTNLGQEMSSIDEGFRVRMDSILTNWRKAVENLLRRGQAHGYIRSDVDPESVALFLLATLQGCCGLAKCANSASLFKSCFDLAPVYLETLRPIPAADSAESPKS